MSTRRNTRSRDDAAVAEDIISGVEPRTELGRALAALRAEIVAAGEPLLDDGALEKEIAERRGGYYRGDRDE
ncbi:MAG TPA: hypothetical protein VF546_09680 [Pyrinomonadaceae bacterium]|jgi:hypothetical protein